MSQTVFETIDPSISGEDLAGELDGFKEAIMSGFSGTTRPTETQPGGYWVDTTNDPTSWSYRLYTGSDDLEIFKIDIASSAATVNLSADSFTVRKISADTNAAIIELVKRRIATNGQVLSGDVVGEVRAVGRTDSSGNPVVAKIIFTADENQTASAFGGTLSFLVIPEGQAALIEHMKFAAGIIETLVPQKINSQILVSQSVATATTIAQLSATKAVVEMTGANVTDIQGINSGHASKVVTIHNRSSVNVTLKHQDLSASAADRLLLPDGEDVILLPQESTTLIYSVLDSRWKIKYMASRFAGFLKTSVAIGDDWTAPTDVTRARLYVQTETIEDFQISNFSHFHSSSGISSVAKSVDGPIYAWGANSSGGLGVGDVVPRSSPVAVLGTFRFKKVLNGRALDFSGDMYGWGLNNRGQLGVGDVTPRSSPVAVVGGLKFRDFFPSGGTSSIEYVLAIQKDTDVLYAWGTNSRGQLGVGDVTARSSPVAVLGGLKFRTVDGAGGGTSACSFGVTHSGTTYGWGINSFYQLGVGDDVSRSSPVAVLGGLKFKKVSFSFISSAIGLTIDGDLYGWGQNFSAQLGVGDTVDRSSPVAVLGGIKFKDFQTGNNSFNMGLDIENNLWGWGINSDGQLGVGDTTDRSSPVQVVGGIKFKRFYISESSTVFAIALDGTLYAWGRNDSGELGVGDSNSRSSPVQVLGGLKFQDVYHQVDSVIALTESGILYGWGNNANGNLGVGDVTSRSSPVLVLGSLRLKPSTKNIITMDIPVVPAQVYSFTVAKNRVMFGNTQLPYNTLSLEVEYKED